MNIYQIEQALRDVIENGICIDMDTGEVLFDESSLNELEITKDEKLLAYAKVIREKITFEKALKEQAESIALRRKILNNTIEELKERVIKYSPDRKALEDKQIKITFAKGKESLRYLDLYEMEKLPSKYIITKPPVKSADAKLMFADLQSGAKLEGVTLVRKAQVRIK